MTDRNDRLEEFQKIIKYEFNNEELLLEALTTPQMGNEIGKPHYEFLETLGDAIIKVIFILKLYYKGIKEPGEITKIKASLESDNALKKIAKKINLHEFIFKAEKQQVKDTKILADVFEAICGALFLDSDGNFNLVDHKLIKPFISDLDFLDQPSTISSKNTLLEFLQEKYKMPIMIELDYEKSGLEHDPIWKAKNPKIIDKQNQKTLITLSKNLKSDNFKNKKDAEKDIYAKILSYLEKKSI
ncbi:MAG: ribonuclease III domain-containing protein [Candidatus Odinarchaeota archaeon]